jgi:hypothetical protein
MVRFSSGGCSPRLGYEAHGPISYRALLERKEEEKKASYTFIIKLYVLSFACLYTSRYQSVYLWTYTLLMH